MRRHLRLGSAALLLVLVAAACSVSTPRDGFTRGVAAGSGDPGLGPPAGPASAIAQTEAPLGESQAQADASNPDGSSDPSFAGPGSAPSASAAPTGGAEPGTAARSGAAQPSASGPLARGVTSETITVSAIAGFSGNYGAILTTIFENGYMVWADDVNANGGIHGRKVVIKKVDNKDTAEGGVAACKEISRNNSAFALSIVGFGGADASAADCLDRAGITTLAFNLSSFSPSWRNVYSAGDAGKQTRPMASFIKNVLGENGKVGVIWTRDPLNQAARTALVDELPKVGLQVARQEAVATGQGSFVAELNRIRSSGATSVALLVSTAEVLGILRDAKALGYSPKWTGNYWPTDENTTAARSLFEGIKVIRNYATVNSPAFAEYRAKARKHNRDDVTNSTTMSLYGMGMVTGRVISNAGASPTAGAFGPAIEKLVDYQDQVSMALTFGPGKRIAEVGMWPMICCNPDNTWRGLGPPRRTF